MKGIIIYLKESDFTTVKKILHEKNASTISYVKVEGEGAFESEPALKMVRSYNYGEKFIPEIVDMLKIEAIIGDSDVDDVVKQMKNNNIKGKILVYDVAESIDL